MNFYSDIKLVDSFNNREKYIEKSVFGPDFKSIFLNLFNKTVQKLTLYVHVPSFCMIWYFSIRKN